MYEVRANRSLDRSDAFSPFRFAEIALARVRPFSGIAVQYLAKLADYFGFDPLAPASERFSRSTCGAILFPSGTHSRDFARFRSFNRYFRHGSEYRHANAVPAFRFITPTLPRWIEYDALAGHVVGADARRFHNRGAIAR
jgi:hypothetical protein